MWLSSSSVGRKFIMAFTGAALVLFLTFHCLLNAIAICWPTAYNSVCEFLGANWYALLASIALAALIVIHIIYAAVLTVKNRKARGSQHYAVQKRPASVEWSSQNMFVLGIVILAFLVVHLIQFWAKMQLAEIRGTEELIPPAAGTLFLQKAFELPWTPIVYIIGFVALWFHLRHGIWSMFQSVGWDSTVWIPRLKKVALWWATLILACFVAQAIVFTVKANEGFYKSNPELRQQYMGMLPAMYERDFGPDAGQIDLMFNAAGYDEVKRVVENQALQNWDNPTDMSDPQIQEYLNQLDEAQRQMVTEQIEGNMRMGKAWKEMYMFINYLENRPLDSKPEAPMYNMGGMYY